MSMEYENKFYVKKGHYPVKMLDRVTSSCVPGGGMMVNKCVKFQSHIIDFENI
jgi:hypothetical protein